MSMRQILSRRLINVRMRGVLTFCSAYHPFTPCQNQPLASLSLQSLQSAAIRSGVPVSICKLLVVGNAKCGKTSVIRRFVQGNFQNVRLSHQTLSSHYAYVYRR